MRVGDHVVGAGAPCMLVAEVAQAHDGSLGAAHAYIDAVAEAGAQAIKFQTHIAAAESTPDEPWRIKFSPQDETRYQYWERMEFSEAQWRGLAQHANERGLVFLSSPFSMAAVDLLERIGNQVWKVGSGELSNLPFLERIGRTGLPVWLSCGMSPWSEIDAAVATLLRAGADLAVMQCTSKYPCPPEGWGFNVLSELRSRYGLPVGYSDHSGDIYAGLGAMALGAKILEVHVTFSKAAFGPDVSSSVTLEGLAALARGAALYSAAAAHPVDKDEAADSLVDMRKLFNKSIVITEALAAGAVLEEAHLDYRKPGDGIPAARWKDVLGRALNRPVEANAFLRWEDLDVG